MISIEVTACIEYYFKLVPNWKTIFWIWIVRYE